MEKLDNDNCPYSKNQIEFIFDEDGELRDEFRRYPTPYKDGFETKYDDISLWGCWASRLEEWREKRLDEIPDWDKVSEAILEQENKKTSKPKGQFPIKDSYTRDEVKAIALAFTRAATPSKYMLGIDERFEELWNMNFNSQDS